MRSLYSALIVLGLTLSMLGACFSCAGRHKTNAIPKQRSEVQRAMAVKLYVLCQVPGRPMAMAQGSGTIIGKSRVLTAEHVISCPANADRAIFIETLSEQVTIGQVVWQNIDADLAALDTAHILPSTVPRVALTPGKGQIVCYESTVPDRARKCGLVIAVDRGIGADMLHSADTVGGNSGAGVYNEFGEIVGVVTRYYPDLRTAGKVSSIAKYWDKIVKVY